MNSNDCLQLRNDLHVTIIVPVLKKTNRSIRFSFYLFEKMKKQRFQEWNLANKSQKPTR